MILILVALALLIYIFFKFNDESGKCLLNPLNYAVQKVEKDNKANVLCSCNIMKPSGTIVLKVTKDNITIEDSDNRNLKLINFTKLITQLDNETT